MRVYTLTITPEAVLTPVRSLRFFGKPVNLPSASSLPAPTSCLRCRFFDEKIRTSPDILPGCNERRGEPLLTDTF
jgi:hypothetical protein